MTARYLVFAGNVFYPYGGMQDLYSSHDELLDALKSAKNYRFGEEHPGIRWAEVFDMQTMKTVERFHERRLNEEFEFHRGDDE